MALKTYDLIILGQGSAAFAAAIKADELGINTVMVGGKATRGATIGGTCVNVGCVPSKNLITVGNALHEPARSAFRAIVYGRTKLDFRKMIAEKDALVRKFRKEKYVDVLKGLPNVEYVPERGRFVSENEVKAGDQVLKAKRFLIATGAKAKPAPVKGAEGVEYLTNEEALSLKELPGSMIVVGGRALGLEFAQMYSHFGTEVTVLQRSERILPESEPEISDALTGYLKDEGIEIQTGVNLKEVAQRGETRIVRCTVNGREREFRADQLLFATGRVPNTAHLDAQKAGVELDADGFVRVNEEMQTSSAHVWAAGDVIGEPMLETIAAKEGAVAVNNAFRDSKKRIDFSEVPRAVFTSPEVASVGLTDAEANAKGIRCACGVLPLDLVPKAHIIGDTRGLIKLVADTKTKRVVGLHILAPHAADLIHEGVLAVKFRLTIDDIIDTVHVFPTLSEAIKLAAQSFYRDVGKLSCCTE
ncbi:MAG: mercury(II) reductase [Thaumarchaeota archaeon]|nr:mercury(II) reductase [Nitrososphaerota archaeon]